MSEKPFEKPVKDLDDLSAKDLQSWENPPEGEGYGGVICDIIDRGLVECEFGGKKRMVHKMFVAIQMTEKSSKGERFVVRVPFNVSMDKKSSFGKFIIAALGTKRGEKFLADARFAAAIGTPLEFSIVHKKSPDGTKTYANVVDVRPWKGEPIEVENYIRVKDRTEEASASAPGDNDVPF